MQPRERFRPKVRSATMRHGMEPRCGSDEVVWLGSVKPFDGTFGSGVHTVSFTQSGSHGPVHTVRFTRSDDMVQTRFNCYTAYAEGVKLQSPASRSARWVMFIAHVNPNGVRYHASVSCTNLRSYRVFDEGSKTVSEELGSARKTPCVSCGCVSQSGMPIDSGRRCRGSRSLADATRKDDGHVESDSRNQEGIF